LFAVNQDGSVQAITSDGTIAWTTTPPAPEWGTHRFIPDFQGGLVVYSGDGASIFQLNGATGAVAPAFTTAYQEARNIRLGAPATHSDGTVFTIDYACHDSCRNQDAVDGAWVVGIDPSDGTGKFRAPLANDVFHTTVSDAFCQGAGPAETTQRGHAWPWDLRI